jgi:hypothetical protein
MKSSGHVEHFRTQKIQTCYVHKLGAFKLIQTTILIIIQILKMILE